MSQNLAKNGFGVGISSGANFMASVLYAYKHKCDVVTIFADDNKKYFSTSYGIPIEGGLSKNVEILNISVIK